MWGGLCIAWLDLDWITEGEGSCGSVVREWGGEGAEG